MIVNDYEDRKLWCWKVNKFYAVFYDRRNLRYFLVTDEIHVFPQLIYKIFNFSTLYQEVFFASLTKLRILLCPMNEICDSSMLDRQNSRFFCNLPTEFPFFFSFLDRQIHHFSVSVRQIFPFFIHVLSTNSGLFCVWSTNFGFFLVDSTKLAIFQSSIDKTRHFSVPIWWTLQFFPRLIDKITDFFVLK